MADALTATELVGQIGTEKQARMKNQLEMRTAMLQAYKFLSGEHDHEEAERKQIAEDIGKKNDEFRAGLSQAQQIKLLYEKINRDIAYEINDSLLRNNISELLRSELPECRIKCDEENNPPDVVDSCSLVARASWTDARYGEMYIDMVFGPHGQIRGNLPNPLTIKHDF